jgi:hypothetical protein
MDDKAKIREKTEELKSIMSGYKAQFGNLEKQLFQAVLDYENAVREKKVEEIKKEILNSHGTNLQS